MPRATLIANGLIGAGLLVLLIVPLSGRAQADLVFQSLGEDRGLTAGVISGLSLDQAGFLWLGSREGLFRYDGYIARQFGPGERREAALSDADVRLIYRDPDDTLWIATNTGGLNRYDGNGRFTSWRHASGDPESISYDSVYGISRGPVGRLWVGTQVGLNRLEPETNTFTRFLHDADDHRSLSGNYVFPVFRDPSDRLWIGTVGDGLNLWLGEGLGFRRFDLASAVGGEAGFNDVFALATVPGQGLYIGTRAGLLRLSDPDAGAVERVDLPSISDSQPSVSALATDGQRLWIGTLASGLIAYDPSNGTARLASSRPLGSEGQLPVVPVLSLMVDDDTIYVGTWGGGAFLARQPSRSFWFMTNSQSIGDLRHRTVKAVLGTDRSGGPWIGSFGGGVQRIDIAAARAEGPPVANDALAIAGVMSLEQMPDGRLFAGATDGLWEIAADRSSARLFRGGEAHGLGTGYVTALRRTTNGQLWVGAGGTGLHRMDTTTGRFTRHAHEPDRPDSLSGDFVTDLVQTPDGALWVGTRSNGLNRCTRSPLSCERFDESDGLGHYHVNDLLADRAGQLWVATDGGGVQRLSGDRGEWRFETWRRDHGLLSDAVVSMVEDDDGTIWAASREGLSRLAPSSGAIQNFVVQNGLPVAEFSNSAAARDDEFLYFGALQGLVAVPVGTLMTERAPSPVRISNLQRAFGQAGEPPLLQVPDSYSLPWGEVLSVEFAVLDFAEMPHEYAYRLDAESEWISIANRNDMTFFGLPAGQHEFSVRGRDIFGHWQASPTLLIEAVPPFWRTTWFQVLVAFGLLLATLSIHRGRVAALEKRHAALQRLQTQRERALADAERSRAELEQAYAGLRQLTARLESAKEDERREISRELHDELGQTLTAAKINLQMLHRRADEGQSSTRLEEAVGMLDGMIQQVRNISLSLRPPLLDEAGLVPALAYHLDSLAERSNVRIGLDTDAEVAGNSSEVRTTTFRVIQEAVNNALRHANAESITVTLSGIDDALYIRIEDDGCGFDPEEVQQRVQRGEHLGLLGMAERVRAAGGTFTLHSEPGHGSRIEARIPRPPGIRKDE